MEIVILIVVLAALVLVAGGATLIRRRRPVPVPPPARPREVPKRPASPAATAGVDVAEPDVDIDTPDVDLAELDLDVEIPDDASDLLETPVRPRFRDRLGKARATFSGYFGSIRSRGIDAETWEELEEALIRADVGVAETASLLEALQAEAKDRGLKESEQILVALKEQVRERLAGADRTLRLDDGKTNVWLFVGVNGVGKTTTIGKVGAL